MSVVFGISGGCSGLVALKTGYSHFESDETRADGMRKKEKIQMNIGEEIRGIDSLCFTVFGSPRHTVYIQTGAKV